MLMAEPVEAVAPQAHLPPAGGDGVGEGLRGKGVVEGGVKAGPMGQLGPPAQEGFQNRQGGTVVEGGQGGEGVQLPVHVGCHPGGGREGCAAMHHPVTHQGEGGAPGGDGGQEPTLQRRFGRVWGSARRVMGGPGGLATPEGLIVGIEQQGLQAGTARVHHQHTSAPHAGGGEGGVQRQPVISGASMPCSWA